MALRRDRGVGLFLLLLSVVASGCGARTTLGSAEETGANAPATGGIRAEGGAGFGQGGRSATTDPSSASGGQVATGGTGKTEDPPPICVIGAATYRNHEVNPLNPCESCQVVLSRKSWSLDPNCMLVDAGAD